MAAGLVPASAAVAATPRRALAAPRLGWYSRPCSTVTSFTIRSMSRASRLNVVVRTSGFIRCLVIDLARENSRSPSAP